MGTPDWVSTWKENASAFDRVRSVVSSGTDPQTAGEIADRARVAESTARAHLERLVEMGTGRTRSVEGTTKYLPDPAYARFRAVRDLVNEHSPAELTALVAEVKEQIETTEREYGGRSPRELRERAAGSETSAERTLELLRAASDLEHYEYRRSLLADAIERYDEYHRPEPAVG